MPVKIEGSTLVVMIDDRNILSVSKESLFDRAIAQFELLGTASLTAQKAEIARRMGEFSSAERVELEEILAALKNVLEARQVTHSSGDGQ
jgi:hypothetical protein